MKKVVIAFTFAFWITLLFPIICHAEEYAGPGGGTFEYMYTLQDTSRLGYVIKAYSHYPFVFVKENPVSGWYRLVTVVERNNTLYCGYLTTHNGYYAMQINAPYPDTMTVEDSTLLQVSRTDGTKVSHNWTIAQPDTALGGLPLYDTYEDAYNALTAVEYEEYFDASIPSPTMQIWLVGSPRPNAGESISTPQDPLIAGKINNSNYYLQLCYKTVCPNSMKISISNGSAVYTPITDFEDELRTVYDFGDLQTVNNFTFTGQGWDWNVPIMQNTSDYFITDVAAWQNDFNNAGYAAARSQWLNSMRYYMPFYGNLIYVYARFYYVVDENLFYGPWKVWKNSYPTTYSEVIPENYQVYEDVPGIENTSTESDVANIQDSSVGTVTGGSSTGSNVTYIQSVPNYPDYPTVASYNHDNLLLRWITTATKLPSMFNGFAGFLNIAFGFIPASFWELVSFGLLCCIAIMIVKVL